VASLALVALLIGAPLPAEAADGKVAEAKAYAAKKLGTRQYRCLNSIIMRESHWNPLAHNRWSGAHGIGQALPATKMRRFGRDYMTSAVTQVRWMIVYVSKYGGACGAWTFWQSHGWY
jgi:hypothetical protein